MLYIIVFVFGAVIGSFLNVCIYRIPEGKSVVTPSSSCPSCGTPIRFYDNIPILSYIILQGRCRNCKAEFSVRYPLVEFINAVLYIAILYSFADTALWTLLVYFLFVSTLIVIFFIDIDHQIIPNSITFPGMPIALILGSTILPDPFFRENLLGFRDAAIGVLAGGGFFYLTAVVGRAILKKEAMGMGDVKMMAMVGGLLGWKAVILTTFMGSLIGSIIGVSLILAKGREWGSKIPFGPYLALGALVSLLYGENILIWYLP